MDTAQKNTPNMASSDPNNSLFERCKSSAAYDSRTGKFICPDLTAVLTKTPIKVNSPLQTLDQESDGLCNCIRTGLKTTFFFHSPSQPQDSTEKESNQLNSTTTFKSVYSQETLLALDIEEAPTEEVKKKEITQQEREISSQNNSPEEKEKEH